MQETFLWEENFDADISWRRTFLAKKSWKTEIFGEIFSSTNDFFGEENIRQKKFLAKKKCRKGAFFYRRSQLDIKKHPKT